MMSAEADGPLRTLAADVIVTNSSLGAAEVGTSTGDGISTACVAGLSALIAGEASAAGSSASGAIA